MRHIVIFLVLIGFTGMSGIATYAELDESILEPFQNNDLVLIGKIIQANKIVSENKTEYNIQVEEYLKNQKPFDMITVFLDGIQTNDFVYDDPIDIYNQPFFEEGNQVFVYLTQDDGQYKMLPYSFALDKNVPVGPPPDIIWPSSPQVHKFNQGEKVVISGSIKKAYLYESEQSDKDSSFTLRILDQNNKPVVSEKLHLNVDGTYEYTFQDKGKSRIPGKYYYEIDYRIGNLGSSFTIYMVPTLWTPLKQIKNGVAISDIECRNNLILIKKYDNTPACVMPETEQKLIERGWGVKTKTTSFSDESIVNLFDDESEVSAFYEKYDDTTKSQRHDHVSYSAGNGDDFTVRLNLYFDENYELTHKRLYCYHDNGIFQYEIAQENMLDYLQNHHCLTYTTDREIPFELVDAKDAIDANNQFAIDFYSQVSQDPAANIFFSPWSMSTAFAIAFEGAEGNTADEMQQVFGFPEDNLKGREQYKSANIELNQDDAQYTLDVANALWLQEGFVPNQAYVDIARDYYDTTVDRVDFTTDGVDVINEWVKQKTQEKITEIFPSGSRPNTKLAITNAIYFNGTWVKPFDPKLTTDELFWITPHENVWTPMMNSETRFLNYTETENLQIVQLPYEGDKLSMLILLPLQKEGDIHLLNEELSAENLEHWKNSLRETKIQVVMPKFELETDYNLKSILRSLGMIDAFGPSDFSIISNSDLFIGEAKHKAFVNVNEKGTEAAAATGIAMYMSAPKLFKADHPFLFIIQDDTSGNILFIGRMSNPT